ncbi:hypothetical protein SAMN02910370_00473 [Lachnospiraceae bacterium XPB1003]|nr:hypothetical protein SAMN02910370_00473 [Lachnospiraceae bacterium XPB1003]
MGLLDGLGSLGFGDTEKISLFEEEKKEPVKKPVEEKKPEIKEEDFLYDKTFECPVCSHSFKQRAVRSNQARLLKEDIDLRPVYNGIDVNKYDVVACPQCGYASLTRFHGSMPKPFRDLIRQNISTKFTTLPPTGATMNYEGAFTRYKLALLNAVVRKGKSSEKAFICLKTAWLLRSMQEATAADTKLSDDEKKEKIKQLKLQEIEYLKNAHEGFVKARTTETPPYAGGMNTVTMDYLIGAIAYEAGVAYKDAARILEEVAINPQAGKHIKENAVDLIALIKQKLNVEKTE